MAQTRDPEKRAKYNQSRRIKYAQDAAYRESVLTRNLECRTENKERYCATRRNKYRNDPVFREKVRAQARGRFQYHAQIKHSYGLSAEQYQAMFDSQGGACAICGTIPSKRLHIDHCHKTGTIRGLLCHHCNSGLGLYRDKEELLMAAIQYLRRTAHGN